MAGFNFSGLNAPVLNPIGTSNAPISNPIMDYYKQMQENNQQKLSTNFTEDTYDDKVKMVSALLNQQEEVNKQNSIKTWIDNQTKQNVVDKSMFENQKLQEETKGLSLKNQNQE